MYAAPETMYLLGKVGSRVRDCRLDRAVAWGACIVASACASVPDPIPQWATHVAAPEVDSLATLDTLEPRLMAELNAYELYKPASISPEQLAVVALAELRRDHVWDAAALLGLASFRRVEQMVDVLVTGSDRGWQVAQQKTDGQLDREDYNALLLVEMRTLLAARFGEELDRMAVSVGAAGPERVAADRAKFWLSRIGDSGEWYLPQPHLSRPSQRRNERVVHVKLVEAIRRYMMMNLRLYERVQRKALPLADLAIADLAQVPLRSFQETALGNSPKFFDARVLQAAWLLFDRDPVKFAAKLADPRPQTRSHVALVLGYGGDPQQLMQLEAARQSESDARVWLSLACALTRLGQRQYLSEIEQALSSPDPALAEHGASLILTLPPELRAEFSESAFSALIRRPDVSGFTRYVAVVLLRDASTRRPLSEPALRAILEAVELNGDEPRGLREMASEIAQIEQFDRARVLRALHQRQKPLEVWAARFAQIARVEDLPFIDQMLLDPDYAKVHETLLRAAGRIPGPEAQAALENWLLDFEDLSNLIASQLVLRGNADRRHMLELYTRHQVEPYSVFFALAAKHPSAAQKLDASASSPDYAKRLSAVLAIDQFGASSQTEGLWHNIGFHDAHFYPSDIQLRQLSLSALINIELNRRKLVLPGAPKTQPTHAAAP